jgi:hypothetical protein
MKPLSEVKQMVNQILESETSERAKDMGLTYMHVARWGKDGKAVYRQAHGELIPIKKNSESTTSHIHDDENLMFLKNALHHQEFKKIKAKGDACLYLQVVHSVAMQLGISPSVISDQWYPKIPTKGLTLEQVIDGLSKNVVINGKKLSIDAEKVDDLDSALEVVKTGVPVIAMAKTAGTIMNSKFLSDGTLKLRKKSVSDDNHMYHALMLFGIDKKHGQVLFRDSDHDDSSYMSVSKDTDRNTGETATTKGFMKLDYGFLKREPKSFSGFIKVNSSWVKS